MHLRIYIYYGKLHYYNFLDEIRTLFRVSYHRMECGVPFLRYVIVYEQLISDWYGMDQSIELYLQEVYGVADDQVKPDGFWTHGVTLKMEQTFHLNFLYERSWGGHEGL